MDHKWPKTLSKIHQTRSNMRAKIDPKSVLEEVLGALGGSWRGSGGVLGEVLGVLGAMLAPRWVQEPKTQFVGPPWTPKLEAKIQQKSVRSRFKM